MFSRIFNMFSQQPQPADAFDIFDAPANDAEYAGLEEVVVEHPQAEDDEEEMIPPKVWSPSLQQQIAELLVLLDEVENAANTEFKPRRNKFALYTTLFLMISATAIAAPTTLIAIFRNSFYRNIEYSSEDAQKIQELEQEIHELDERMNVLSKEHDSYYEKLYAVIGKYYDQWFAKDANGISCATGPHPEMVYIDPDNPPTMQQLSRNYVIELLCYFENELNGLSPECEAIAREGCNATMHDNNFPHLADIDYQRWNVWNDLHSMQDQINKIQFPYLGSWGMRTNFYLVGLVASVGLLSVLGLIVAGKKYWNSGRDYRAERAAAFNVNQSMAELAGSAEVVQLLGRLNIVINDQTTLQELVRALQEKSAEIDYRWQQRTAFLGIAKRPESQLCRFFHNGAINHDVKAKILNMANLGPRIN